jgi:hypothetical protein
MKWAHDAASATIYDHDAEESTDGVICRDVNPAYATLLTAAPKLLEAARAMVNFYRLDYHRKAAATGPIVPGLNHPVHALSAAVDSVKAVRDRPPEPPVGGDAHG